MKRIISIILCIAMLSSMVAMSVSARWVYGTNENGQPIQWGDAVDEITTENIMTFTLDKEKYEAGDVVKITVAMEEIWGDPALEGPSPAYPDDGDWPGAYGMVAFSCAVIYDTSVFTAKAYTAHNDTSTILNYDSAAMSATNLRDAIKNGAYNVIAIAPDFDADLNYGNFNGSGDLWTYNLTINASTPDGVYYLPVGPYVKTVEGGTYEPVIKFDGVGNENLFGWNGQATSFLADYIVDCTYKTNCDGVSFIADDAPEGAEEYECAYIKIVVGEDTIEQDKAAAAEVDALIEAIGEVTVASRAAILKADEAYVNLTDAQKAHVKNYDVLVAAIERYDHLITGHTYETEVVAPTCTEQGYTVHTCTVCGDVETEYTPALGHDLITIRTEQTCITAETEYKKCQREGCNYQSEVIEIKPAAGHTPSTDLTYIFVEPATCTEDGLVTVLCSVCEEVATEEVIPATGHTPSEDPADITDTSTCVDAGQIITKCSICGDVATVVDVPAKGHVPSTDLSYIFVEPATCSADGSVTTLCSVCGDVANYEIIPALNHMYDGEEYAWGESYIGTYPTVDSVGYHAKDCQLCGEVWEYQEIEKLHDADFMVIDGVLTEYCGDSDIVRIPGNVHTINSNVFASHNSELVVIPTSVMNICSEAFIGATTTISYLGNEEGWNAINKAADWDSGATLTIKYSQLGFTGASVTLENDLKVNYKLDKTLIDNIGFENLYVVFEINGVETIVTDYEIVGKHYVFSFADISPKMMNDTINATVYATYDGTEYSADAQEYSIAKYCYNLLFFYAGDENAKLRTLLVDMLNYGAACQTYTGYNTDDLANANLTAMQSSWGTATDREFVSVLDTSYDTVANASVTWKGAGLVLGDSVVMRFKLAADSIDGLTVKIASGDNEWLVDSAALEESDGAYYVYFDKLTATQMSEDVFVTVYDGDTAVSNTLRYSIESYAESMQNESNADFVNMLRAMIKYGDSAKAFAN